MVGISSKAAWGIQNKEKTFQGQRFDDDFGLNWVQFKWRNHDPQIGRFVENDPLSDKYVYNSTYAFSENKVTAHVELEGLESKPINGDNANMPIISTTLITKFINWLSGVSNGSNNSTQPDGVSFTHKDGQGANTKSKNPTGPSVKLDNLMDAANGANMLSPLKPKPGESQWFDMWEHAKNVGDEVLKDINANNTSSEQKTNENKGSTATDANTTTKPPPYEVYSGGASPSNKPNGHQGTKTAADPAAPDTIYFTQPGKPVKKKKE